MIRLVLVVAMAMIACIGCGIWWMSDDILPVLAPRFSTASLRTAVIREEEETFPQDSKETEQLEESLLQIPSTPSLSSVSSSSRRLPFWQDIPDPASYTYDSYLRDIPDKLIASEKEYQLRKAIFDANWASIRAHNTDINVFQTHYLLGLNTFMDQFDHELPLPGYDKTQHKAWNQNAIDDSIRTVTDATRDATSPKVGSREFDYWETIDLILQQRQQQSQGLPISVDWRIDATTGQSLATPVKAQGHCGSCWAFASTAAMETHVAMSLSKQNDNNNNISTPLLELSMQELVSCVPNPNHCGGSGGCGGSTAELALDFVHYHGMVDEWHFGYQSFDGHHDHVACSLPTSTAASTTNTNTNKEDDSNNSNSGNNNNSNLSKYYEDAVATVKGYVKLPSNNYTALMHTVAKLGPVIVNVASDTWRFYESGVFVPHGHSIGQTDINHVVVLMGYGTDETTGEDYWLVRNSYGSQWGEEGYIRLKRVDPASLPQPDADCGMDVRPAHGIACTEGDDDDGHGHQHHHHITPPAVKVCGTSGILFDPVLPYGAQWLGGHE